MADIGLVFDSGVKTLELSDGRGHSIEVVFNPYDVLFLGAIMDAAEKLDAAQARLTNTPRDDWKAVYAAALETDKEMRGVIDGVFNAPVCDALFPHQTVHAIGNGFPAWANLLYAVVDHMDAGLTSEKEKAQQRIRKYSDKYRR